MQDKNNSPYIKQFNIKATKPGALNGLNFCVKDNIDIQGFKTGAGNPGYRLTQQNAQGHAACVGTLLNSGASINGKTKMCEFAYGILGTENPYGSPINPNAKDSIVGGSSSGSASAVASGLADFSLGTDTACSVRLPASLCGIFGMRPSRDQVPMQGVMPLSPSLDTLGWFAGNAKLLTDVGHTLLRQHNTYANPITLLIAKDAVDLTSTAAKVEFNHQLSLIKPWFHSTTMINIGKNDAEQALTWFWYHAWSVQVKEAWDWYTVALVKADYQAKQFNVETLSPGAQQSAQEAAQHQHNFAQIAKHIRSIIKPGYILCIPSCHSEAPALTASSELMRKFSHSSCCLLAIAGIAGLPQITLPLGSVNNKPFGISLIGWHNSDIELLNIAQIITKELCAKNGK